jgi:hypothetical protein
VPGGLSGFELAIEDNGGKGEFLFGEAELGAKEISAGLRPVRAMRPSSRGVRIPESRPMRDRS